MEWRTKEGKIIKIEDMETTHIENCLNAMKEGRINMTKDVFIGYTQDGDGDGAIWATEDCNEEYYEAFENELNRRSGMLEKFNN